MAEYKFKIKTSDSEANFEQNCRFTYFYFLIYVDTKHEFYITPRMTEICILPARL